MDKTSLTLNISLGHYKKIVNLVSLFRHKWQQQVNY